MAHTMEPARQPAALLLRVCCSSKRQQLVAALKRQQEGDPAPDLAVHLQQARYLQQVGRVQPGRVTSCCFQAEPCIYVPARQCACSSTAQLAAPKSQATHQVASQKQTGSCSACSAAAHPPWQSAQKPWSPAASSSGPGQGTPGRKAGLVQACMRTAQGTSIEEQHTLGTPQFLSQHTASAADPRASANQQQRLLTDVLPTSTHQAMACRPPDNRRQGRLPHASRGTAQTTGCAMRKPQPADLHTNRLQQQQQQELSRAAAAATQRGQLPRRHDTAAVRMSCCSCTPAATPGSRLQMQRPCSQYPPSLVESQTEST